MWNLIGVCVLLIRLRCLFLRVSFGLEFFVVFDFYSYICSCYLLRGGDRLGDIKKLVILIGLVECSK